ncbi:MAG: hypothetical protein MI923_30940, partial [Phycisphaerales bacterium]|nr:hypothetical protein [Phycisphaerales bacterium]
MQHDGGLRMRRAIGVHAVENANVVGMHRHMREKVGDHYPAVPARPECGLGLEPLLSLFPLSLTVSLPFSTSSGLWSKESRWLGPPYMNMKMTRFALGTKLGSFGATGLSAPA